jgi:hypothetical protein
MSLVLNVEILGEFRKLTTATQGAQGQLQGLNNKISGFAKSASRAFASIGLGLSFAVIARELTEATKAAIDDRKSQELLATAMLNTGKATDASVKAAEAYISQMQTSAAVADDELRPAYQKLFIATGDVTQSNKLLQIALDASAGTGKSLDAVSQAMAKSLAGSDTALIKLIPSLKNSKTPIDDLAKAFEGASEKAANLDPYQRMQVMWSDMQEKIGTALLPVLDKLSTWLASPKGEETIQKVTDAVTDMLDWLTATATWTAENGDWLVPLVTGIASVAAAWKAVTVAVNATKAAIALATAAQVAFNAIAGGTGVGVGGKGKTTIPTTNKAGSLVSKAIGIPVIGTVAAILATPGSTQLYGKDPSGTIVRDSSGKAIAIRNPDGSYSSATDFASSGSPLKPGVTNNIVINNNTGTVTGSDITGMLNKFANNTGTQ